ncbi:MAG: hypothetical protein F6K31_29370 [Symploca sp. SIO2G7]|nr:hypothetical protein [Symploca sp. SIO2G7]
MSKIAFIHKPRIKPDLQCLIKMGWDLGLIRECSRIGNHLDDKEDVFFRIAYCCFPSEAFLVIQASELQVQLDGVLLGYAIATQTPISVIK